MYVEKKNKESHSTEHMSNIQEPVAILCLDGDTAQKLFAL